MALSGRYRTSSFRVIDEDKYQELMKTINADRCYDYHDKETGELWHAFGSNHAFDHYTKIAAYRDYFFLQLSEIIHEGDACVYNEHNYSGACYTWSDLFVVTRNNVECRLFEDMTKKILRDTIGKENAKKVKFLY